MKTIKIWNDAPSDRQLQEIARDLRTGQTMIWPTDTMYALACDALNPKAIDAICRLKGINPEKQTLSIVCADIAEAAKYGRLDNDIFMMLRRNTPGPFTFICRAASTLPRAFKGRKSVGIRIPACETDLAIVRELGNPILTTSVEAPDDDYMSEPSLLLDIYDGRVDILLDAGRRPAVLSTVVDCTGPEIEITRQGEGELA